MKKFSLILLFLTFILISKKNYGQEFLGLRQSNYAGIMGSDLNPASIADSRYKFDLVLFSMYFGGYNNHAQFNARKMPHWWIKSLNDDNPKSYDWLNNGDLDKLVSVDSTALYKNK